MRVDSLFPLMDGVPAHRAACGMVMSRVGACASPLFSHGIGRVNRLVQGRGRVDQFEEAQS